MRKTTIIFDLDNDLAPATAIGEALSEPAFDAVRAVNHDTLTANRLEDALADCWVHAFDWVARTHGSWWGTTPSPKSLPEIGSE